MRIVVLHYDLMPGEVTDAIIDTIRALAESSEPTIRPDAVALVCGRAQNADTVVDALRPHVADLRLEVWPEVDSTDPGEPDDIASSRAERIVARLSAQIDPDRDLLWIHNHHSGTNPSLTRAVCAIAAGGRIRLVLHIHDFPEAGRYADLAYVERVAGRSPYPAETNVSYVTINARDAALLRASGIRAASVHCIPNPVRCVPATGGRPNRDRLIAGLAAFARERGHRFHPDRALVLYPVRAVRRKNVLELATICRLAGNANLIVALPDESFQERDYSAMVDYAYAQSKAHGVFGIGCSEHRFGLTVDDLTRGADAIASSSVQEGFGAPFVKALASRVPLFARRLGVFDPIAPLFDGYPARLYDRFVVPTTTPSIRSMRGYLQMRYVERLSDLAERAPAVAQRLLAELRALAAEPTVDFALLPAQLQMAVLSDTDDDRFAEELRALNATTLDALNAIAGIDAPDVSQRIDAALGPHAFASAFAAMYQRLTAAAPAGGDRYDTVSDALVDAFATADTLRLLLGPLDHDPH
ncbi:MAG: hypothetical protein EA382_07255 [Spirochaetaceae bacterium]|nr:MAG: hypothetical protein EA382_07255 [Spirochaetaceae bacterium]